MSLLESFATSGPGRLMTKQLGLKDPPSLRRGSTMPAGELLVAVPGSSTLAVDTLRLLDLPWSDPLRDLPAHRALDEQGREQAPVYPSKPGVLVLDAVDVTSLNQLELLRQVLRPAMKGLEPSGRIIFLGPHPDDSPTPEARAVAEALDGLMRTIGKELRGGATANLLRVRTETTPSDLASTLCFLIQGRSAFVSGQTWEVGHAAVNRNDQEVPCAGRVVVVTGAARGIGAAIARTFGDAGARVVAVDLPTSGAELTEVAVSIGGSALQLDITADDAAQKITRHITTTYGRDAALWAIVHNAGITRDKMTANLDERRWQQVIDINIKAEIAINDALLNSALPGSFDGEGRIVGIASTSGIAGQKGQANYAASKAGVIGYTEALAAELSGSGITVNAVAPGFIETDMTAEIPFVSREIYRRANSLGQGGRPVDVAETIAYLCNPASGAVTGQTVRVCGQNLVGK